MKLKAKIMAIDGNETLVITRVVTRIDFRYYDEEAEDIKSDHVIVDGDLTGKRDKQLIKAANENLHREFRIVKIDGVERHNAYYGVSVDRIVSMDYRICAELVEGNND